MDPLIGSALIQSAGSLISGFGQGKANKEQAKAQRQIAEMQARQNWQQMGMGDRQFGQTSNLNRAQFMDQRAIAAADLAKRMAAAPGADRANYLLQARLGLGPQAFQARDYTRGGMPGAGQATGGYAPVVGGMQAANAGYRAGMGGLDTSALQAAQARLQSMAGVPGEYQASDAGQMRMQSEIDEQRELRGNAQSLADRQKYNARIRRLQDELQGYPAAPRTAVGR